MAGSPAPIPSLDFVQPNTSSAYATGQGGEVNTNFVVGGDLVDPGAAAGGGLLFGLPVWLVIALGGAAWFFVKR